jgi:hypothetical protein
VAMEIVIIGKRVTQMKQKATAAGVVLVLD